MKICFVIFCLPRSSLPILHTNSSIQLSVAVLDSLPGLCVETEQILACGVRVEANPLRQDKEDMVVS